MRNVYIIHNYFRTRDVLEFNFIELKKFYYFCIFWYLFTRKMNVVNAPYSADDRWEHLETLVFSKNRNGLCFQARTLYISECYVNMFSLPIWLD